MGKDYIPTPKLLIPQTPLQEYTTYATAMHNKVQGCLLIETLLILPIAEEDRVKSISSTP